MSFAKESQTLAASSSKILELDVARVIPEQIHTSEPCVPDLELVLTLDSETVKNLDPCSHKAESKSILSLADGLTNPVRYF